jgi:hypothetical protein
VAVDSANHRLLVADDGLQAILAVDTVTGARSMLSGATAGSGPALSYPRYLTFDSAAQQAWLIDNSGIVELDTTNGDRTSFSALVTDAGATITQPYGMTRDTIRNRLIVRDLGSKSFVGVALDTKERSVVAPDPNFNVAAAPYGNLFSGLDYDATHRILFTATASRPASSIAAVDELSGDFVTVVGRAP